MAGGFENGSGRDEAVTPYELAVDEQCSGLQRKTEGNHLIWVPDMQIVLKVIESTMGQVGSI